MRYPEEAAAIVTEIRRPVDHRVGRPFLHTFGLLAFILILFPVTGLTSVDKWFPVGPPGVPVKKAVVVAEDPPVWLVTTEESLLRSEDGGLTWEASNEGLPVGRAWPFPHTSVPELVYALTENRRFYMSTDGGRTWFEHENPNPGINQLYLTNDPNVMYALDYVGHYWSKVLKTEDGGLTWNTVHNRKDMSVAVDPTDSNLVIAGGVDGLFRSANGGQTWRKTLDGGSIALDIATIEFDPVTVGRIYASGAGFWVSEDWGMTWERFGSAWYSSDLQSDTVVEDILYAGSPDFYGIVARSQDGGHTFSPWSDGMTAAAKNLSITPGGSGILAATYGGLFHRRLAEIAAVSPGRGPTAGGTEVTIAGGRFGPCVAVSFGESSAENVTVLSETTLKAVTPSHTEGAVDVTVVTPEGRTVIAKGAFLYGDTSALGLSMTPEFQTVKVGETATWTVEIEEAQPYDIAVSLSASEPSVLGLPSQIVVAAGTTEAMVQATTFIESQSVWITARLPGAIGGTSASARLDIVALGISLTPEVQWVRVGETATWTLEIGEAQPNDIAVSLSASAPAVLDLPLQVVVAAGTTQVMVQATTLAQSQGISVTARLPGAIGGASSSARLNVVDFEPRMVIPGVARVTGSHGSEFRTSMWITNPGTRDIVVRLRYVPAEGQTQGGASGPVDVPVFPSQSRVFDDVLHELFTVNVGTFGSIVVETLEGAPPPVASARTFNDSSQGTFGQYIEAVDIPGEFQLQAAEQIVVGLGGDSVFRSNLGVINLGDAELHAELTVEGPDGQELGDAISLTLPPFVLHQVNRVNVEVGVGGKRLFNVRVRGDEPFFSYGSMLDNTTSDPVFVPAAGVDSSQNGLLGSGQTVELDGVAAIAGANDTFFRSSLVARNMSDDTADVDVHFCKWGDRMTYDNPVSFELDAGETVRFVDVVSDLFNRTGVAGTLHFNSWPQRLVAWARTYNDGGTEGTFGQFVAPIFYSGQSFLDGPAVIHGISEDGAYRTNMGIWAYSDTSLEVSLFTSDGNLVGHKEYQLASRTQLFIPRVARDLGASSISDGYLRLTPGAPRAVVVWTSSVDNRSSDQTFMRPMAVP